MTPSKPAPWLWPGAALVFLASLALLIATEPSVGYARDEGFYFHASRAYQDWLELLVQDRGLAMRPAEIDKAFSINSEHPPLAKLLFAVSASFYAKWPLLRDVGTAFRLPTMLLAAMLTTVLFVRARASGLGAALVAAFGLLLLPRFFYHAHLACFDVPIVALFFFTVLAYERALSVPGLRWPLITAVLFGLALLTKHNSWFLPILFVTHAGLLTLVSRLRGESYGQSRRALLVVVAMSVLGPLLLWLGWPWLWRDPIARFAEYAQFHLQHEYYNMEFLGETYFRPPFPRSYAPLMTLATVPLSLLGLAVCGAARIVKQLSEIARGQQAEDRPSLVSALSSPLLIALAICVAYGPWLSSGTPIFGGTKHWMPAYPFAMLLVAWGFESVRGVLLGSFERLRSAPRVLSAVLALTFLAPAAAITAQAHPFGLSAYTPLVGGAPGAASLGLNRTFWGYTTSAVLDEINRETPRGGALYLHDTAYASYLMFVETGRLRQDIRVVSSVAEADVALYHHEMHMAGEEYQAWVALGTTAPLVVRGTAGVPVVWLYKRTHD